MPSRSAPSSQRSLIAALLMLLACGFLATSLLSYFSSRSAIRDGIINTELPLTSDTVYSEIQKDLIRPVLIASMMAQDTFLRDWVLAGEQDAQRMTRYLGEVTGKQDIFTSFFVSERTLTYYQAKGVLKQVQPQAWRDAWYFRLRDQAAPYEINVDLDMANQDNLTVFINYKVHDYQQRFIGAAGVGLSVSTVVRMIDQYQHRYQRSVVFVDAQGKVLMTGSGGGPQGLRVGQSLVDSPDLGGVLAHQPVPGEGSHEYRDLAGHSHFLNVRHLPELDWYLLVDKRETGALDRIRHSLYLNLAICAMITLVVVALVHAMVRRHQASTEALATLDSLTGLPNRNKLFRFLEDSAKVSRAVLMLDLDNFKPINDSLGHPAGDAVLMEVAMRLGQMTRSSDLVARLGGDEFVIVLIAPGARDELDRFCARLIDTLKQPMAVEHHKVQVGASLGVVMSDDYPGGPSDLIRYADVALYGAKQSGKNTWRYFSTQMSAALLEKRVLEQELREGIPRGELRLHFQPRFKVDGVTIASAEALVRWEHPRLGLLMPDDFVGLAEQSDVIVLLGNWVLQQACSEAGAWPLEVIVSVNMSPAQFSRSDVVRDVAEALRTTGLPAHRLELEITENVMLNDVEGALQTMNALKELGVRLNMDDFGTGYSSLGYLRTYPFDSIKIDRRFVQSLGKSSSDRSVVQAIISLGNAMGMTVTAEGVETAEQLALLSDNQCHEVQGYFLSRPVNNQALIKLMTSAATSSYTSD
ncbi:MAG TPA: hypothetical protein DIT96_16920 [Pseudomonas sp.]|nr:hypothetical protein [Pseudomonas sp.]